MARKQAPSMNNIPTSQAWRIPKRGEDGEWYPIIRVGRHIPFGYEQDESDPDLLQPIPLELEMLEQAKKYLAEYSLRMVAYKEASEKARKLEGSRLGGVGTRSLDGDGESTSES
jgi:hypothetical protein